jgi:hypothetical protein
VNNNDILNTSLSLALEWGEDWLKPIQKRLAQIYPELSATELDTYNVTCRKIMDDSFEAVYELPSLDRILYKQWEKKILALYPWISEKNLSHLFSQGCYYAVK